MATSRTTLMQPWVLIAGAALGTLTLLFFMGLVVLSVFGKEVPCDSRYLVVTVIAFGASLSTAFLGGAAAAKGAIPLSVARDHPLTASVSGGVAVLVILLALGNHLFSKKCDVEQPIACADTYQSYFVPQLHFGFCFPREGWELDKGPIDVKAADIYLRNAANRDVGIHFHVSLIPASYADKHDFYTQQVANTWRQLDPNLSFGKVFLAGREAFQFGLVVKDRKGISRPTEVVHIYLTSERLLEIISTRFEETTETDRNALALVRSSLVIEKY